MIRHLVPGIFFFLCQIAGAAPPGVIQHQGRVAVGGVNFDGTGHFKFALVNAAGDRSFWSNDGSSAGGGEPTAAVSTAVARGHYAVALGDAASHANMTGAIPAGVFAAHDDVHLRVWFSATGAGDSFEQLAPDRRLTSAGYALCAQKAKSAATLDGLNAAELLATVEAERYSDLWQPGAARAAAPAFLAAVKDSDPGIDGLNGAWSVAVSGGIAFVASQFDSALAAIDVSDPADPQFLAAVKDSDLGVDGLGGARGVAVSGGIAFVASFSDGALAVIDVSDPADPQFLAAIKDSDPGIDALGGANGVAVSGGIAFVASSTDNALAVIDVSDPADPQFLAAVKDGDPGVDGLFNATGVAVSGGIAFVASRSDHALAVIDVGRPATTSSAVGIGTDVPVTDLHLRNKALGIDPGEVGVNTDLLVESSDAQILLASDSAGSTGSAIFFQERSGGAATNTWSIQRTTTGAGARLRFNFTGATDLMQLQTDGDLIIAGTLTQSSDRDAKENIAPVDPAGVLDRVATLPIATWNYRHDNEKTPHLGPMAQDFRAAFGLGPDDRHIATVDADGVALAAIQGLNAKVEAENKRLRAENDALCARLEKLEKALETLSTRDRK